MMNFNTSVPHAFQTGETLAIIIVMKVIVLWLIRHIHSNFSNQPLYPHCMVNRCSIAHGIVIALLEML